MKKVSDLRRQAGVSHTTGAESLSPGHWLRAWHNSRDKGQTIVEFALIMPILLAVMLAIFELGILLLNYQTLTQCVDQGGVALQQIVGMGSTDPCATVSAAVLGTSGNLVTTGANGIQLKIQIVNTLGSGGTTIGTYNSTTQPAATFSCGAAASYAGAGSTATVTGTYPAAAQTFGFNFLKSIGNMTVATQELMQ